MIRARVHLADVEKGLRQLDKIDGAPLRRLLFDLRKPLHTDQREHGRDEKGPSGPWKPRALSTISKVTARRRGRTKAGKRRAKRKARKLLGKLPRALVVRVERRGLTAVSRVPWSGVHQEGGKVGRGATVPARPFLWFSDQFLDLATAEARKLLGKEWGR